MDCVEVNPADHRCIIEDDVVIFARPTGCPSHEAGVYARLAEEQSHRCRTACSFMAGILNSAAAFSIAAASSGAYLTG